MNLVYHDFVKRYLVLDEIEFVWFTRNPVWVVTLGNTVVVGRFWLHWSIGAWRARARPTGELDLRCGAQKVQDMMLAQLRCRGGAEAVQGLQGCRLPAPSAPQQA